MAPAAEDTHNPSYPKYPRFADYSTPGSSGYNIVKDITLNDPSNRRLKIISVGCGLSTVGNAYHLQRDCQNVEHIAYEKNADIGGTWFENTYPGVACDIPSHAYTMLFALNPNWPRFLSTGKDIWEYLNKICEVFDLRKYFVFNTEVIGAYWQEDTGKWLVRLRATQPGLEPREFEDTCDLLLYAKGILNTVQYPELKGMEKFKGKIFHTARWPKDYTQKEWEKDRIAVLGSGASSIQVVPSIQPHAKHLDIFVRTGVWFVGISRDFDQEYVYSEKEKAEFRDNPEALVEHAKSLDSQINGLWDIFFSGSAAQKEMTSYFYRRMEHHIHDPRLLKGFTPEFGIGCRRVTPGDPYMRAIQEDNVDVHFTAITELTEDGVIGEDGIERKVDTIICATGFDVSYRPTFPIIGRNGVSLAEKWKDEAEGYLGLAVPDMPNFIIMVGPAWPIENGSALAPGDAVGDWMMEIIKKMQNENIHSWDPKHDVTEAFNEHVQEWVKYTVWKDGCRSWYKNNKSGRVNAVWPGSAIHYRAAIQRVRWEDMNIKYHYKNMWAYLGMGFAVEDRDPRNSNLCPYITVDRIDPKWLEAIGSPVPKWELKWVRPERERERAEGAPFIEHASNGLNSPQATAQINGANGFELTVQA